MVSCARPRRWAEIVTSRPRLPPRRATRGVRPRRLDEGAPGFSSPLASASASMGARCDPSRSHPVRGTRPSRARAHNPIGHRAELHERGVADEVDHRVHAIHGPPAAVTLLLREVHSSQITRAASRHRREAVACRRSDARFQPRVRLAPANQSAADQARKPPCWQDDAPGHSRRRTRGAVSTPRHRGWRRSGPVETGADPLASSLDEIEHHILVCFARCGNIHAGDVVIAGNFPAAALDVIPDSNRSPVRDIHRWDAGIQFRLVREDDDVKDVGGLIPPKSEAPIRREFDGPC